jgi:hypothetical protein
MPNLSSGTGSVRNITLNSGSSLTIGTGGVLDLYGNISGAGNFTANAGSIVFRGTTNQSVPAFTTTNLTMNGSGGLTPGGNITVTGTLTLTNGNITLGANNITLAGSSTGSVASHIITNGTGNVIVSNLAASSSRTIPVGTDAGSYNPVTLSANTGHTTDNFTVNVKPGVFINGVSGTQFSDNVVNRTWNINESLAGGSNVNVLLQWTGTQELTAFQRNRAYIMLNVGGTWVPGPANGASGSDPYSIVLNNLAIFGPFAVASEQLPQPITGIYPNPATTALNVILNMSTVTPVTFSIYDSKGSLLMQTQETVIIGLSRTTLNISKLASGVYVLKVSAGANDELMVQRFVKGL